MEEAPDLFLSLDRRLARLRPALSLKFDVKVGDGSCVGIFEARSINSSSYEEIIDFKGKQKIKVDNI